MNHNRRFQIPLRNIFASTTLIAAGVLLASRSYDVEVLLRELLRRHGEYPPTVGAYGCFFAGVGVLFGRPKAGAVFGMGVVALLIASDVFWPVFSRSDVIGRNLVAIALVALFAYLAARLKRQGVWARDPTANRTAAAERRRDSW